MAGVIMMRVASLSSTMTSRLANSGPRVKRPLLSRVLVVIGGERGWSANSVRDDLRELNGRDTSIVRQHAGSSTHFPTFIIVGFTHNSYPAEISNPSTLRPAY